MMFRDFCINDFTFFNSSSCDKTEMATYGMCPTVTTKENTDGKKLCFFIKHYKISFCGLQNSIIF